MKNIIASLRGKLLRLYWCLLGLNVEIGKGLKIYKKMDIRGKGKVSIGDNCLVSGIPGDKHQYVTIYTHSIDATITIGNNVHLCAARISSTFSVSIGNDVTIEESGITDSDFHSLDRSRGLPKGESMAKCKVAISDRVVICAKSIVTKGVTIGQGTIIIPGTVVSRSLPANCFAGGNPVRIIQSPKADESNS